MPIILIFVFILSSCSEQKKIALDIKNVLLSLVSDQNNNPKDNLENGEWELPPLPKVLKDSTSLDVYNKSSAVFKQGEEFNKLSIDKKKHYHALFIQELFWVLKGVMPSDREFENYLNNLLQNGSREALFRVIVSDENWAILEERDALANNHVISFAVRYASRFLNISYKDSQLKQVNAFVIKRVLVEKTLDLLQELTKKPEDLYRWYAVFSAFVARYMNQQDSLRSNTDPAFHDRWVRRVPWDHIQSEVIVKILIVINQK